MFETLARVEECMETITQPYSVVDAPGAGAAREAGRGKVEFRAIGFDYGGAQTVTCEGLNLTIPPGQKVGLIGRSGAGKSTLVNLLLRFYDLKSGEILIDGQDISRVTQRSLRRHIAVVTQDNTCFIAPSRRTSAMAAPRPATRRWSTPRSAPTPTISSWSCTTRTAAPATAPRSANGASNCPAASASASPSPG